MYYLNNNKTKGSKMNPFTDEFGNIKDESATSKIMKQIESLPIGGSLNIERYGLSHSSARGCISSRMRKKDYPYKFRFKVVSNDLWALRTK